MIAWLKGFIIDKQYPSKMVIDVNGVGYDVEMSLSTFFHLEHQKELIGIYIHTIVREDAFLLYGFYDKLERALFRALIKVNGVGPKVAIGILSSATPAEIIQAITSQNTLFLTKLPGIGKKTAERVVMEMKDNLSSLLPEETPIPAHASFREQMEAISALEALGYKAQDAQKVIKTLDDGHKNCEQLIRQALQVLAQR